MPPEIADSDAESDLGSPKAPAYSPILENAEPIYAILSDPLDHVDFSQYLSPTQRLSSMIEQQENTAHPRSTGSTDRFLKEIDELNYNAFESTTSITDASMKSSAKDSTRKRQKRRFSEIENGTERRPVEDLHRGNAKRSKTHSSMRSQMSDSASPLFLEDTSHNRKNAQAKNGPPGADFVSNRDYGSREFATYSNNGAQDNHHSVSTTRSSMGGYQGYEMDFRGAGVGIGISANPFGSLSQISADGEMASPGVQYLPGGEHGEKISGRPHQDLGVDISLQSDTLMQMATSPVQSSHNTGKLTTKKKALKAVERGEATAAPVANDENIHRNTVKEQRTGKQTVQVDLGIVESRENVAVASEPKKRGRKPKSVQATATSAAIGEYELDEFANDMNMSPIEQYKPRPSRSRASTVDSTAQASDLEKAGNTKQHQRNKPGGDVQTEELSSELHLNDPQIIGAPIEVYNPRPSKSRARRIVEDEQDETSEQPELPVAAQDRAVLDADLIQSEAPVKPKKKASKKSRASKSKASIADVTDKAEGVVVEGSKDVIVLDESPAKANTKSMSHLSSRDAKQEHTVDDAANFQNPEEDHNDDPSNKNFTIDLPPIPPAIEEAEPLKPEPKKRGRKPKKKVEVLPEPPPQAEPEKEPTPAPSEPESKPRQPLVEKDPNTLTPTSTPSSTSTAKPASRTGTPPSATTTATATTATATKSSTPLSSLIKPRVGLSRRTFIPPLLRKLDRTKEPPKTHEKKEKLSKKQKELEEKRKLENEIDGLDADDGARWKERGADGMLVEWND